MSRFRGPAEYVSKAKHRWAGHIMRRTGNRWTLRTLELKQNVLDGGHRPDGLTRCTDGPDVFSAGKRNGSGPRELRRGSSVPTSWITLARDRNGWEQSVACTTILAFPTIVSAFPEGMELGQVEEGMEEEQIEVGMEVEVEEGMAENYGEEDMDEEEVEVG
ncbi:unnamed protein product [Strongylus vulgaris]|uniref:Uncharacterized protein n=1 Tax=Strongylus vulgaris TaxID=40348 RepID=A0A3P7LL32_STRVU|nr:unnamed protein product [Strongylus vulgaris]